MSDQTTSQYYAIVRDVAWVKVSGRANCLLGVDFLGLIRELVAQDIHLFALDLRDCQLMDSSFLGVLAGLEQEFGPENLQKGTHRFELVNPNQRVTDLIENLGLHEYFKLIRDAADFPEQWIPVPPSASRSSRLLCSKLSLQGHEVIIELNPANEAKFRDVVAFLKEDVKRLEAGEAEGK